MIETLNSSNKENRMRTQGEGNKDKYTELGGYLSAKTNMLFTGQ